MPVRLSDTVSKIASLPNCESEGHTNNNLKTNMGIC